MPVNLMCQAVIPYNSGLPTDVITNNWSFRDFSANSDHEAAADVLNPFVQAFYEDIYESRPQYVAVASTWEARWYNRDAPPPRAPYILPLHTGTASGAVTKIPSEVSAVLSFQGVRISGSPQARRRGRIFLGALNDTMIASDGATIPPTIALTFAGILATAAENLLTSVEGAGDYMWTVWSPTTGSYVQVTDGWIDNAPDTQRRRGVDPTFRTLWPTP